MVRSLDTLEKTPGRVLLRCDYNVPIQDGQIIDDYRIRASVETIGELKGRAEQIIIVTHRGRPTGHDPNYSTKPIAEHLKTLLGHPVHHVTDPLPKPSTLPSPSQAPIILLENIRFVDGETTDSDHVAKRLADLADIYVNDAFGATHRQHSSTHAVQRFLPSYKGRQVEAEQLIGRRVRQADGIYLILGGAKIQTKLDLADTFTDQARKISLGGTMHLPFYKANGLSIGNASIDDKHVDKARKISQDTIHVPEDMVVTDSLDQPTQHETVSKDAIPEDSLPADLGEQATNTIQEQADKADLIVWNGPLGYYETDAFARATNNVMEALSDADADIVIGGGDTAAIVNRNGNPSTFYHVSTGGGAFLTLLTTGELPAFN